MGVDSNPIAEELAHARLSAALRERLTGISANPDGDADGNADAKRARTEAALPVSQRVSTANDWEQADGEDDELLAEMLRVAEAAEAAALGRRYDSVVAVADGVGGAGGGCDVGGVGDGRRETDEHSDDEWLGEG